MNKTKTLLKWSTFLGCLTLCSCYLGITTGQSSSNASSQALESSHDSSSSSTASSSISLSSTSGSDASNTSSDSEPSSSEDTSSSNGESTSSSSIGQQSSSTETSSSGSSASSQSETSSSQGQTSSEPPASSEPPTSSEGSSSEEPASQSSIETDDHSGGGIPVSWFLVGSGSLWANPWSDAIGLFSNPNNPADLAMYLDVSFCTGDLFKIRNDSNEWLGYERYANASLLSFQQSGPSDLNIVCVEGGRFDIYLNSNKSIWIAAHAG